MKPGKKKRWFGMLVAAAVVAGCSDSSSPERVDAAVMPDAGRPDGPMLDRQAVEDRGRDRVTVDRSAVPDRKVAGRRHLVMAGGGLSSKNDEVYGAVVKLAGGKGKAAIGVITAASIPESKDPKAGTQDAYNSRANGAYYLTLFATYGARASWIPVDLDRIKANGDPKVVSLVNKMSGFFIGGGDQSRLVTCFKTGAGRDSPVLAAIRRRFLAGAVVGGTSAGTAILSGVPMVTGGESYEAVVHGAKTKPDPTMSYELTYDPNGGFGLFSAGPVDTHFSVRGRQGRLIRLASDLKKPWAVGVEEDTAAVVTLSGTNGVSIEAVGEGGVQVFDLSAASRRSGSAWGLDGVLMSYLTRGDRLDLPRGLFVPASWKTKLAGREYYLSPMATSTDVFSSPRNLSGGSRKTAYAFVKLATRLIDHQSATSARGLSHETGPQVEVVLTRDPKTERFQGYLAKKNYYAFFRLRVDVGVR